MSRTTRNRNGISLFVAILILPGVVGAEDTVLQGLRSGDDGRIREAINDIRSRLTGEPVQTVDQLNRDWMAGLMKVGQYSAVDEFAIAGTRAVPAYTWRIEQLQKHRVKAVLAIRRPRE